MPDETATELLEDYKNAKTIDEKDDIIMYLVDCDLAVLTYIMDLALETKYGS